MRAGGSWRPSRKRCCKCCPIRRCLFPSGEDFNDFIFLASQEQVDVEASSLSAEQKEWLNQRKFSVESEQGIVLTDDFNPLEHMQVGKSEHYRDVLVSWFGNELLIR